MFQQSSLRQQEGRCVAAGRHHASVTFKDNEPVAESTADRSNLRVHLSSLSGGGDVMINEVDEGLARTKTNEADYQSHKQTAVRSVYARGRESH